MQTLYSVSYSHFVYYILSIPVCVYSSLCNVLFTKVHCTCTHVLGSTNLSGYGVETSQHYSKPLASGFLYFNIFLVLFLKFAGDEQAASGPGSRIRQSGNQQPRIEKRLHLALSQKLGWRLLQQARSVALEIGQEHATQNAFRRTRSG